MSAYGSVGVVTIIVAFPRNAGPTPADLVSFWNSDDESVALAVASAEGSDPAKYNADLVHMAVVTFAGVGVKTAAHVIVDRLRRKFFPKKNVYTVQMHTLDDGTTVAELTIEGG